jgi:hypothetical protein
LESGEKALITEAMSASNIILGQVFVTNCIVIQQLQLAIGSAAVLQYAMPVVAAPFRPLIPLDESLKKEKQSRQRH